MKSPDTLSGPALVRAIDKSHTRVMSLVDRQIAEGRGHETYSTAVERAKAGDLLAMEVVQAHAEDSALRAELERRRAYHGSDRPIRRKNPRPRKYANAAEKQAAFRNRWASVEIRTTPEQAALIEDIARERDISRSELLYAMLQFALTNHNWRNPTFTARLPQVADLQRTGDYHVQIEYDSGKRAWIAQLRDSQMNIVAKPREFTKRPVGLTWEDFEPYA